MERSEDETARRGAWSTLPLVVILVATACDPPGPGPITDLPEPAVEALEGVERVPDELLSRDGYGVERIAVGPDGATVYGAVDDPDTDVRVVEWGWDEAEGRWAGPEPVPFSPGASPDTDVALAPDGSYLLFSSARPTDQMGAGDYNIWLSQWEEAFEEEDEDGWSDPWLLPVVHSPAWDGSPSLAMNGNLYFASERDEDTPGRDIFVSRLDAGMWEAPQTLSAPVNSVADESDPWIAPDESFLLFSSNREGSWDLYISWAEGDGDRWTEPSPLASPVVSAGDERAPALSLGGEVLFFVRDDGDLWWAPSAAAGVVRPDMDPEGEEVAAED